LEKIRDKPGVPPPPFQDAERKHSVQMVRNKGRIDYEKKKAGEERKKGEGKKRERKKKTSPTKEENRRMSMIRNCRSVVQRSRVVGRG
jgi:hypothetical protein